MQQLQLQVLLCVFIVLYSAVVQSFPFFNARSNIAHRRGSLQNPAVKKPTLGRKPESRVSAGGGGGSGSDKPPTDIGTVIGERNDIAQEKNTFKRLFDSYNRALLSHPYITKIISSAIVGGLGDLIIQLWLPYQKGLTPKFDLRRFAVFSFVAGFYIAPTIHVWFDYLNAFPVPSDFSRVAKALVMIFLDQTIGAVVINGGFFFAFEFAQRIFPPYRESFSLPAVWKAGYDSVRRNMWSTMVMNWYSWPIINFLNFLYIPVQFQLLVANVAAVFWNMFLSDTANSQN